MIKAFAIQVGQLSAFILAINVLLLLFSYRKSPAQIQAVLPLLLISLTIEIISRWLMNQQVNNLFLLHLYTLLEFLAWTYFYYILFRNDVRVRKSLPVFAVSIAVLIIANSIFLEPLTGFNSNAKTLVQCCLIGYAIYYFFDSFGKVDLSKPLPRAITFINFALILYYSGSLFIFMFPRILQSLGVASSQINGLWAVNALLYLIFQVLILFSLWTLTFRRATSS